VHVEVTSQRALAAPHSALILLPNNGVRWGRWRLTLLANIAVRAACGKRTARCRGQSDPITGDQASLPLAPRPTNESGKAGRLASEVRRETAAFAATVLVAGPDAPASLFRQVVETLAKHSVATEHYSRTYSAFTMTPESVVRLQRP
jgi:hypothetical protein